MGSKGMEKSYRSIFLGFWIAFSLWVSISGINEFWGPQIVPYNQNQVNIPSYDGILWNESPQGISVKSIDEHSVPELQKVKIGDVLQKIDGQRLYSPKAVREILETIPPGSVLMYQFKRPTENELYSVLLKTAPKSIYFLKGNDAYYSAILYFLILIFSILALLLVFPFVSLKNIKSISVFSSIILLITIVILLTIDWYQPFAHLEKIYHNFEILLWNLVPILILFWGILARISCFEQKWLFWEILPDFLWWLHFLIFASISGNFSSYQYIIPSFCAFYTLKTVSIYSFFQSLRQILKIVSFGIFGISAGLFFLENELIVLFSIASLLYYAGFVVYKYLRIGKIRLVAQQFILITILILVFAVSYWSLGPFVKNIPFEFQNTLRIILSLIFVLISGFFIQRYKHFFSELIASPYQNKVEKLQQFQIEMIRYVQSNELLKDFQKEIQDFLGQVTMEIYIPQKHQNPTYQLYTEHLTKDKFWSRSNELSSFSFPQTIKNQILSSEWELIYPIFLSEQVKGLLLLGKKTWGNYNLEEVELLQRITIQLSLILNLLYLVEKEKLLMQKTLEANLTALRSQINPHFLFNALNTISALIHDSPDLAEEAVDHLAFIFRYTLKTSSEQFSPLQNEIELVRHYLDIEKIRFGKRLDFSIDVQQECLDVLIPGLSLQTLVENCIKHGIGKITGKGLVSIRFYQDNEYVIGKIYDNGPGIKQERILKGTGLKNVVVRMQEIYGRNDLLTFENTGDGTLVTMKIPLNKSS